MSDFSEVYENLNSEQKRAVDLIDGPLLVVAGPGTGKTQLLSARVANILQKTDTLPQNILCLTFTESGAANMRERLTSFIGKEAYDVQIGTYHAFGGDIIRRYSQYFTETRLEQPVDELGKHQIVANIVESLGYRDALKQTRHHIGDLIATISEVKRALLSPEDLRAIAKENSTFMESVNQDLVNIFAGFTKMPTKLDKAEPYFVATLESLQSHAPKKPANQQFGSLAGLALYELTKALEQATAVSSQKPLTAWKNKWLAKNSGNQFILAGMLENRRLESLANVLEAYQNALAGRGLYDFDDMILRAIGALEQNNDLRYTLQEQYLYVLLDEYQDTNAAQAKLVQLLTDNPLSEGRPNVMAVGDDDQAIYAFQGAQYSNMLDFFNNYQCTALINLHQNYRSRAEILQTATNIAGQISERLFSKFEGLTKQLTPANSNLPPLALERVDFKSDVAQADYVSGKIATLIKQGVQPKDIVVLSPKHKQLESLVGYLNNHAIPVRYDKREDILQTPVVTELLVLARLAVALARNRQDIADSLWPQVLSFDFWQIPTQDVWRMAWIINRHDPESPHSWAESLLNSSNEQLKTVGLFFISLAGKSSIESLETMLDYLIGNQPVLLKDGLDTEYRSPLRGYYARQNNFVLYETLSHLTVLRLRAREHQKSEDAALRLSDLLELSDAYRAAQQPMLHTSPYSQAANSVQLMTVYKSKGLEFDHVFLLSCNDETWGSSSRSNSNKLTLPANLAPIRHSGVTEDERLRLLFVAVTRAKFGLYLPNYLSTYSGKNTVRLKYFDEREDENGNFIAYTLPNGLGAVINDDHEAPSIDSLQTNWQARHLQVDDKTLRALLQERINMYQLSPTHLGTFCDLIYGGPQSLFFNVLLRFPTAPGIQGEFGNTIHESLQWVQNQINQHGQLPPAAQVLTYFSGHMKAKKLLPDETERLLERGALALTTYLEQRGSQFVKGNVAEKSFKHEGVFIGDTHMAGKIDRLDIDPKSKTITVIDYKTGKPFEAWRSDDKLHKYRQQLYCYKLLIEHSHSYVGYTVTAGRLEFVEPDEFGKIHSLELQFNESELDRTKKLLAALWKHVHTLDFPDTASYDASLKGIKSFEDDLLEGRI
ncbi:MAG: ATP-dependent DNA helicase [Candidatus Saccharimonadales bacterium]